MEKEGVLVRGRTREGFLEKGEEWKRVLGVGIDLENGKRRVCTEKAWAKKTVEVGENREEA